MLNIKLFSFIYSILDIMAAVNFLSITFNIWIILELITTDYFSIKYAPCF